MRIGVAGWPVSCSGHGSYFFYVPRGGMLNEHLQLQGTPHHTTPQHRLCASLFVRSMLTLQSRSGCLYLVIAGEGGRATDGARLSETRCRACAAERERKRSRG